MKKILLLFCNALLIGATCSHTSLFAQNVQSTQNLPIIESKSTGNSDYYVIFLTGNGGYRKLAQSVTQFLNSKNISVLAVNIKKYLWSEKSPDQIACDLETLIDRYNNKWSRKKVVFLGYSMGAEILPFAIDCMEDKYMHELIDMILIGPWQKATFKVKIEDYFFEINKGTDIYEELLKMKTEKAYVICDDNKFSICRKDLDGVIDHDFLGGGHHFGGDYSSLTKLIGKRLNLK
jgi:type IV secretory pathway VirJ component